MKKSKFITGLFVATLLFTACEKSESKEEKAEKELREYVKSIEEKVNENSEDIAENWNDFEEEFKTKSANVKEESLEGINETWNKIKEKVNEVTEDKPSSPLLALYATLGLESQNAPMVFVTQDNIVNKYRGFVNHVQDHKTDYSTDDWENVQEIWKALNERKEALEPLHVDSTAKITALKAEFLAIKVVNKTESAVEETLEKK